MFYCTGFLPTGRMQRNRVLNVASKGCSIMKSLGSVLVFLVFLGLQLWLVVWVVKRFLKRSNLIQKIREAAEQAQAAKLQAKPSVDAPKLSPEGIVRETLDESLAKHQRKMQRELAELMQSQGKPKK
jgi:hypothetical protein